MPIKVMLRLAHAARPLTHMLAYPVARAMLINLMGLVMFGAAGALLRAARETAYARRTATDSSTVTSNVTVGVTGVTVAPTARVVSYCHGVSVAPKSFAACLPSLRFIAIPIAALAIGPIALAAPSIPTVTTPLQAESQSQSELQGESQYQQVRHGVMAGYIKPSVRGIQSKVGGGTAVVRRYLKRLETEGVTARLGQGWIKNPTA